MPYYEIIFETGTKALAYYEDDDEALSAAKEHHKRALAGDTGGPSDHRAERVHHIEVYNNHPADLNADETMSSDVMLKELQTAIKEREDSGVVSVPDIAAVVRDLSSPLVAEPGAQESMYKAKPDKVIDKGWE